VERDISNVAEASMRYSLGVQLNPISAVTAASPYAYYDRLATERPFAYDDGLACWVAAGESSVEAALTRPELRVRPVSEPVPRAMQGTVLGTFFSKMVRMNDGAAHDELRAIAGVLIDSLRTAIPEPQTLGIDATPGALMFAYPSRAIAAMLGIGTADVIGIEGHARGLARAIGPGATADDIRQANAAVERLCSVFFRRFRDELTCANAIAFLFQGYDSLAGSIGHALYPYSDRRELAVHNTRRFAAEDVEVAGTRVEAGSSVLVVLASAPRYAFGTGPHACLAARLAPRIVDSAVAFARGRIDLRELTRSGFLPLQNARIPVLVPSASG
jgi:hypothetical protein